MSPVALWDKALADLEAALGRLEEAGPEELEAAALAWPDPGSPARTTPVPAALEERAIRLQRRMVSLIHELEGRRAAVGSEVAALTAAPAADRSVPKFFDTKA